jgi:poly(3-hydroxyalkanoate) synthetase
MMSLATSSILKEYQLSPHDIIYLKGKTRLLHYHGIKEKEGEGQRQENKKISILGYCWGGILALIYTALEATKATQSDDDNNTVKSLALMATPVDFSKENTILTNWSKAVNIDKMIHEFGDMNGQILDLAFAMRNPLRK